MTFDDFLTILEDNKVPYKYMECLIGNGDFNTYVFNIYLKDEDLEDDNLDGIYPAAANDYE
tara:strand:- start:287 stop:469 length:183 start_codon:yes stop_codon:yes gene_type:complete